MVVRLPACTRNHAHARERWTRLRADRNKREQRVRVYDENDGTSSKFGTTRRNIITSTHPPAALIRGRRALLLRPRSLVGGRREAQRRRDLQRHREVRGDRELLHREGAPRASCPRRLVVLVAEASLATHPDQGSVTEILPNRDFSQGRTINEIRECRQIALE